MTRFKARHWIKQCLIRPRSSQSKWYLKRERLTQHLLRNKMGCDYIQNWFKRSSKCYMREYKQPLRWQTAHLPDDALDTAHGEALVVGLNDPLEEMVPKHLKDHADIWDRVKGHSDTHGTCRVAITENSINMFAVKYQHEYYLLHVLEVTWGNVTIPTAQTRRQSVLGHSPDSAISAHCHPESLLWKRARWKPQ